MDNPFFDAPILNSPYAYPSRHWELDHCYREKLGAAADDDRKGDQRKEAEKNKEAARPWISGLAAVHRTLPGAGGGYFGHAVFSERFRPRRGDTVPLAEFTGVWQMQVDFAARVEAEFNALIASVAAHPVAQEA